MKKNFKMFEMWHIDENVSSKTVKYALGDQNRVK